MSGNPGLKGRDAGRRSWRSGAALARSTSGCPAGPDSLPARGLGPGCRTACPRGGGAVHPTRASPGAEPSSWEDPAAGPAVGGRRFSSVFAVAATGPGRSSRSACCPTTLPRARPGPEDLAAPANTPLPRRQAPDLRRGPGEPSGEDPNRLRYAGRDRHRADPLGGRRRTARCLGRSRPPEVDPWGPPRLETRAPLPAHLRAPPPPGPSGRWGGPSAAPRPGRRPSRRSVDSLTPVTTPGGRRPGSSRRTRARLPRRAGPGGTPPRLLPSGGRVSSCCRGADRDLMVPDADRRNTLWTFAPFWPGCLLVSAARSPGPGGGPARLLTGPAVVATDGGRARGRWWPKSANPCPCPA